MPVQATTDASGTSRAELRRRTGQQATVRPAVVWGRDAATAGPSETSTVEKPTILPVAAPEVTTTTAEAEQPLTRRRARTLAKPGVSTSDVLPVVSDTVAEVVEPSGVDGVSSTAAEASVAPESIVASTAEQVAEAPVAVPVMVEPTPHVAAEPAQVTAPFELLEPVDVPAPASVSPADERGRAEGAEAAASGVDAFEAAARLFSFTGETPVQRPAAEPIAQQLADEPAAEASGTPAGHHRAKKRTPRRTSAPASRATRTRPTGKRIAAASFSVAVVGVVGLLTVGMTLPQQAIAAVSSDDTVTNAAATQMAGDVAANDTAKIQAYVAPADAAPVSSDDLDRSGNYSTGTLVELAGTTGISNLSSKWFTNNPACAVQWPFAVGVPITYGFGPRPGEFHEGVDFTPGAGAHIQAIADGTVRVATEAGGGYGVMIIIDHIIDGKLVSSRYAHMQHGSLQVHAGEKVQVGQYIGRTGNTGFSFGAHTHLEILQNGVTPIDPLPWLHQHATC